MTSVVAGGAGPLAVTERGSGDDAWLFLHSLGGRAAFWEATLAHVGARARAIAFDQRGHGASPAGASSATLDDLAADAVAVLDALGVARATLVGHSFGAAVAMAVAARAPSRVRQLVLVDAGGSFAGVPAEGLAQFVTDVRGDVDGAFVRAAYEANLERAAAGTTAAVLGSLAGTPREVLADGYAALFAVEPETLLARFGGPVTLIADAANESPFSLHRQAPQHGAFLVERTSHWIPLDQPAPFHALLDQIAAARPAA